MQIDILTLFPEMFKGPLSESLIKKACEKGLLSINLVNLRDFATDKHKTADDSPYGGGAGMVMKVDVISAAINKLKNSNTRLPTHNAQRIIYMCPTGKTLTQQKVKELSKYEHLTILCGHYEGIDERARTLIDEEVSIGDYVLTGGELPAMVLIDAVARYIPGVVKEEASVEMDSFSAGLLDYPSYTRPEDFNGKKVPDALLSGHHADIATWRRKESLNNTFYKRPDLLAAAELDENDRKLLGEIISE
ncbi:MAG: tRNA (guanosine(37)-N1)-methyltransferase TrmD [Candidatus Margulisiibacteriota bacterium]